MIKRRLLFLDLALLVLVVGWSLWFVSVVTVDPIGPASYQRIQFGMTQAEIEAIIGLPPGDYNNGPPRYETPKAGSNKEEPAGFQMAKWTGTRHSIVVVFDEEGMATSSWLEDLDPPTKMELLKWWLGL